MYKFLLSIVLLLFFISCSSEKPVEKSFGQQSPGASRQTASLNTAPYSLEIIRSEDPAHSTLYVMPKGFEISNAKIQWLINDREIHTPIASRLSTELVKRGDKIQAKATLEGKEILSNIIYAGNSKPEITSVKILPEIFKPGDRLSVDVTGSDRDDDEVTILYEWIKNGEPAGTGKQIDVPLKRGDKVSVKITPFDGEDYGTPIILRREIMNMPPMITEEKKMSFDGDLFTLKITANDVDGDELTYSLKSAPDGMVIDPVSGMITWKVPREFQGKVPLTVCVNDGHGGEAVKAFNLDIKPASK
jgi:hypothetical protein